MTIIVVFSDQANQYASEMYLENASLKLCHPLVLNSNIPKRVQTSISMINVIKPGQISIIHTPSQHNNQFQLQYAHNTNYSSRKLLSLEIWHKTCRYKALTYSNVHCGFIQEVHYMTAIITRYYKYCRQYIDQCKHRGKITEQETMLFRYKRHIFKFNVGSPIVLRINTPPPFSYTRNTIYLYSVI